MVGERISHFRYSRDACGRLRALTRHSDGPPLDRSPYRGARASVCVSEVGATFAVDVEGCAVFCPCLKRRIELLSKPLGCLRRLGNGRQLPETLVDGAGEVSSG